MENTIQKAMSEILEALGFTAMARDVLNETDVKRLKRYARVCVQHTPGSDHRVRLANLFRTHKPALY